MTAFNETLADVLTRVQKKKLQFLIDQGATYSTVTVFAQKANGTVCTVDPFGRVEWLGDENI